MSSNGCCGFGWQVPLSEALPVLGGKYLCVGFDCFLVLWKEFCVLKLDLPFPSEKCKACLTLLSGVQSC